MQLSKLVALAGQQLRSEEIPVDEVLEILQVQATAWTVLKFFMFMHPFYHIKLPHTTGAKTQHALNSLT